MTRLSASQLIFSPDRRTADVVALVSGSVSLRLFPRPPAFSPALSVFSEDRPCLAAAVKREVSALRGASRYAKSGANHRARQTEKPGVKKMKNESSRHGTGFGVP